MTDCSLYARLPSRQLKEVTTGSPSHRLNHTKSLAVSDAKSCVIGKPDEFFISPHLKVQVPRAHIYIEDTYEFLLWIPDTDAEFLTFPFASVEGLPFIDKIALKAFDKLWLIRAKVNGISQAIWVR